MGSAQTMGEAGSQHANNVNPSDKRLIKEHSFVEISKCFRPQMATQEGYARRKSSEAPCRSVGIAARSVRSRPLSSRGRTYIEGYIRMCKNIIIRL